MKNIILFSLLLSFSVAYSQIKVRKHQIIVDAMYGRHFANNYIVDSGSANIIANKWVSAWRLGATIDYEIKNKLSFRTGIAAHLLMLGESLYGVSGSIPPLVVATNSKYIQRHIVLGNPSDRLAIGIPVQLKYIIATNKTWDFSIAGGAYVNFYFAMVKRTIESSIVDRNANGGVVEYIKYEIIRPVGEHDRIKPFYVSKPKLEWDFDVAAIRKFKKKGGIVGGIRGHLGTKNLETAYFTIWPNDKDYRSKGHYSLNRSYIGVYVGFRFGKN